ncbi:MAG: sensor domain-containing diguanylate cyclase [Candidatus Woesearchaeota archaeon]|jgi:diguanylate cyclase (GGDEF)-like protein|nr:sensor domain-containing diguanylate cyclase [Candidatus Woesearchaeota archaeon]
MRLKDHLAYNYYKYSSRVFKRSTLKSKIKKDLVWGFFLSSFLGFFVFVSHSFIIEARSIWEIFIESLIYFFNLIIILIVFDFYLYNSINKNLFVRFKNIQEEMKEIMKGNLSKRISNEGEDELDEMIYFTNDLLDKLEQHIENEKKYSLIDPLTNCYNRRALTINSESVLSYSDREKKNFTIAVMDLDNFKTVNDTHGHKVGDDVLVTFSKVIKGILRKHDSVYRIGGEEFMILLSDINVAASKKILERLRKDIPYQIKKQVAEISCNVTFSCGFVNSRKYNLKNEETINKMIEDADVLSYKAKKSGKDKIVYR